MATTISLVDPANVKADSVLAERQRNQQVIREVKARVIGMLEERRNLPTGLGKPSQLWSDVCSFFDYLLFLPEDSFCKLRYHTYHITGDNYQTYYFGKAESFQAVWRESIQGVPWELVLGEPHGAIERIGFNVGRGRLVSRDILRFQHVVNTLYWRGIIQNLTKSGTRSFILEIGAGYGGLAHHLSRILGNATCVIVDLPETLLYSGAYLSLLNPQKRILIYERNEFKEPIYPDLAAKYDFILIPNYRLELLHEMRFDLGVNMSSFQEMRLEQVEEYLDFAQRTCRFFYSWNQDRQPQNSETVNITQILKDRFDLDEITPTITGKQRLRRLAKSIAVLLRLLDDPSEQPPYREYICK